MNTTTAHGRTRTLNESTGIDGSGRTIWIVWTENADGSIHHMERFTSLNEARVWMKWA